MIKLTDVTLINKSIPIKFNLTVPVGEFIAIVGASGAGKSTLLNIIAGFELVSSGAVYLQSIDYTFAEPAIRPVSILFQEHNTFEHLTVMQNIGLGLSNKLKLSSSQQEAVHNIATQVGVAQYLTKYPTELSGGEKQRIAIARCLLRNKPILLLDEPFSALDPELRTEILLLIKQCQIQHNLTILLVTHQLTEVVNVVDRVLHIEQGQIVKDYPTK